MVAYYKNKKVKNKDGDIVEFYGGTYLLVRCHYTEQVGFAADALCLKYEEKPIQGYPARSIPFYPETCRVVISDSEILLSIDDNKLADEIVKFCKERSANYNYDMGGKRPIIKHEHSKVIENFYNKFVDGEMN